MQTSEQHAHPLNPPGEWESGSLFNWEDPCV